MKTGYDQFFKKARENASNGAAPKSHGRAARPRFEMKDRPSMSPGEQKPKVPTVQEIRARMQAKKKKKRAGIPWKLVGTSFIGLLIAGVGYQEHERIESFLKRIEISVVGSAQAESAAAKPQKEQKAASDSKEAVAAKNEAEASKKEFTQEDLNHFSKLNERKRELDAREEELSRMEAELASQKSELEKRLSELEKTRRDISSVLQDKVEADDKKIDKLVDTYSNMKPQQAAKVFEEMDEDLAVEVIGRMKKKNAAEIMNLIKPEKAKVFAEKFAGYKRN